MIKQISLKDFIPIYKNYITKDFPLNERRPLNTIKKLYKKDFYTCFVMYSEKEELLAYACFISIPDMNSTLLDYFAVTKNLRGTGIGSRFLEELKNNLNIGGIIIESEMPEKASNNEEMKTRKKRIQFYERNGSIISNVGWKLFGVDYNLLWLPIKSSLKDIDILSDIQNIYSHTMPKYMFNKFISSYETKR